VRSVAVLLCLLLVVAGVGAWLIYAPAGPAAGTPDAQAIFVDIAPGSGTAGISALLERAGVIRSRYAFDLLRAVKGGTLKAGEYRFNHPAPVSEVYTRLVRGDVFTIAVTIPEGYNIFDIANAFATAGLANRDAFLAAERTEAGLIADLSPGAASLEGYLYPDTYRFPRTASPETMLAAMVRRFRQEAAQLGLSAETGHTVARTVTMASLIEKEVAVDSERPVVAGVFENRLHRGIPLATDPTIIYAAELAGRWRGTIYASDLHFESPYNTYRRAGLPPGPICNPGAAALRAAIHPTETDYLYFVADAQGHSRFAATLDEHTRNVQAYRKATGEVKPPPPPKPAAKKRATGKRRR
jgi:UPF0755 protein